MNRMEETMKSDFIGIYFTVDDFLLTFAIIAAVLLILFILLIVNVVKTSKLKKRYEAFMMGKDAASLEDTLMKHIQQVEELLVNESENRENIQSISNYLKHTFQKVGMVKYDAFNEMGGKLSFAVALLDKNNSGWILNAMHSREGCYTYIKEIIKGESYVELAEEEAEALDKAIFENYEMDVKDVKK